MRCASKWFCGSDERVIKFGLRNGSLNRFVSTRRAPFMDALAIALTIRVGESLLEKKTV